MEHICLRLWASSLVSLVVRNLKALYGVGDVASIAVRFKRLK